MDGEGDVSEIPGDVMTVAVAIADEWVAAWEAWGNSESATAIPPDLWPFIAKAIVAERERCASLADGARARCDINECAMTTETRTHECRYANGFSEWRYDSNIATLIRQPPPSNLGDRE